MSRGHWTKGTVKQLRTSCESATTTTKTLLCTETKTVTQTWYHLLLQVEGGRLVPLSAPGSDDPNLALLIEGDVITVNHYWGPKQNFCQMTIHFEERAGLK